MENSQAGTLSEDEDSRGFDLQAGQSWIYPTNYALRDYQFNIVQTALFQNTLVSLPTGLGKTFIAAVVMYNFFRWFPRDKIIFMAPTRPLVKQQIDACYNIMAIPREVTTELTGSKVSLMRTDIWQDKRVFFATPQVLQNDLNKILELGSKIKCLVFDEAHKARGNHAYCEVIRRLKEQNHRYFRVLALSATPGSTVNDVLEVVRNLLISHLEFRTEESIDVRPYVFHRSLETVVVPLGDKLQEVKNKYIQILERFTRTLLKYKVITGNCSTLTKGRIFMTMKEFQQKQRGSSSSNYSEIMRTLNICITLYHAYELLERHGLRSFLSFFDEHKDKPLLRGNEQLTEIMEDVRMYLGPAPNVVLLPDGTIPDIPKSIKFGHPKYYKLQEVLWSHFKNASNESRVIVFFEYRESVMEAYALLLQTRPLIKPKIFLGQGSGITQKIQVKVVKDFREGLCNVLLSTSIGEEGLDVGEVDLIVCFDISTKSPIRMVQRMGRTGRKREGRIVVLVTEGKEQQTLRDCLIHKNNIANYVLNSSELLGGMYPSSPRLVPQGIQPRCEKIYITVKPVLTKKSTLKDIFRTISSTSSEPNFSPNIEIIETVDRLPKLEMLCNEANPLRPELNYPRFSYTIEKQRSLQPTCIVRNSKSSEILVDLLQIADSRRFNIPMSQMKSGSNKTKNFKQSDIRNMFIKTSSQNDFQLSQRHEDKASFPNLTPASQPTVKETPDCVPKFSKEVFTEISTYLSITAALNATCKYCPPSVECIKLCHSVKCDHSQHNSKWIPLNDSVFENITLESLKELEKSMGFQEIKHGENEVDEFEAQDSFANIQFTQLEKEANEIKDESIAEEKSFSYQPPRNLSAILNKCSRVEDKDTQMSNEYKVLGVKEDTLEELLDFFKLLSIEDFFCNIEEPSSQETITYSPDVIDESPVCSQVSVSIENTKISPQQSPKNNANSPILSRPSCEFGSPVLSTSVKLKRYKRKIYFDKTRSSEGDKLHAIHNSTPIVNVFASREGIETAVGSKQNSKIVTDKLIKNNLDISDIFETSTFGELESSEVKVAHKEEINLGDICDMSIFGIEQNTFSENYRNSSQKYEKMLESDKDTVYTKDVQAKKDYIDLSILGDIDDFCDLSEFGVSSQKEKKTNVQANENTTSSCIKTIPTESTQHEKKSQIFNKTISQMSITQMLNYIGQSAQAVKTQETHNQEAESVFQSNIDIATTTSKIKNEEKGAQAFVDLIQDSPERNKQEKIHTNLATSIVNNNSSSLKLIDDGNYDDFNFSFNTPISKKSKLSTNKNVNVLFTPLKRKEKRTITEDEDPYKMITQSIPTTNKCMSDKAQTSTLNSSETASDDEFEIKPKSPVWIRPKLKVGNSKRTDENVGYGAHDKPSTSKSRPPKLASKRKNTRNPFIEIEAELSDKESVFVSDDEENYLEEDLDCYDESFVEDETQYVATQMHAKYLQSIRSPARKGTFKIPVGPKFNVTNIYSQPLHDDEENTYLDDSFCVGEEHEETQIHELSELEILEMKLKERKRRKKSKDQPKTKRQRILVLSDDSD